MLNKILLINKYFFLKGGAERVFFQERDFLLRNGYSVLDFSMRNTNNALSSYSKYFIPDVDFSSIRTFNIFKKILIAMRTIHNRIAVKKLNGLLLKELPQIAHLHNIYHQITPSIIPLLKRHNVAVVMTLHDYKLISPNYLMLRNNKVCNKCKGKSFYNCAIYRCHKNSFFSSFVVTLEAYFHKWLKSYDNVDIFISPSKFLAELLNQYGDYANRIRILPNGIDTDIHHPTYQDDGYILYFGRISQEKGIKCLSKAYKILNETRLFNQRPIKLKIIGDGPLLNELKVKYPNIEFLGYQTGNTLNSNIKKASFVVVPSQWYENCSMSVLEAMAYGKPVIGARIGGIPEQIEDYETGLLFEPGNANELAEKIRFLIMHENIRQKMGRLARKRAENFYSLKSHQNGLLEIYNSLITK